MPNISVHPGEQSECNQSWYGCVGELISTSSESSEIRSDAEDKDTNCYSQQEEYGVSERHVTAFVCFFKQMRVAKWHEPLRAPFPKKRLDAGTDGDAHD